MSKNTTYLLIEEWYEADQVEVNATKKDLSYYHVTAYGKMTQDEADEIDNQAQRWSPYDYVCPDYYDDEGAYNDALEHLKSKGAKIKYNR